MNKIIALNWKDTQTAETAGALIKTVEDVAYIYPNYTWIVFPGDNLIQSLNTKISLGVQVVDPTSTLPYSLIGHMSQRMNGKTDEEVQQELESIKDENITPIFCVGPLHEEDTLK